MSESHLAVVFSTKGLPQNTEQARAAVWAEASRLLQRDMGKLYDGFYPSPRSWGSDIRYPFGVVMGRDDPAGFLRLYKQAREKREATIDYHVGATLLEAGPKGLRQVGDTLICPVILDGKNKRLTGHVYWHMALKEGAILPDCGVYYAERKRSLVEPGLEKTIESSSADYALCVVVLTCEEGRR